MKHGSGAWRRLVSPRVGLACASFLFVAHVDCAGAQMRAPNAAVRPAGAVASPGVHRFFGVLLGTNGSLVTIRLRSGRLLVADIRRAYTLDRVSEPLYRGKPAIVTGTFLSSGVLGATALTSAGLQSASWGIDR